MDSQTLRLLHGYATLFPTVTTLRAGPVQALYEQGQLRRICVGQFELIRQIYSAVRDHNWETVSGLIQEHTLQIASDHFEVEFDSLHQAGDVHFSWRGRITGSADGTIVFHMLGEALARFRRNRIGFCVLHPMECAGRRCRLIHTDGSQTESAFPITIAPHQPFFSIRAVQHEYAEGRWVEVLMEGDTFEMEDQRNWLDASYKTYCTPLSLPFPVEVTPGTRIEQRVTVRLLQSEQAEQPVDSPIRLSDATTLRPNTARQAAWPMIGLCASSPSAIYPKACERLQKLRLDHLRLDVRPSDEEWTEQYRAQVEEARCTGLPIEVAVHLGDEPEAELSRLQTVLAAAPVPVLRYLIFKQGEKVTSAQWLRMARRILGQNTTLIGGTDAFFTELNRERPGTEEVDGVIYSINPQVHAFDDQSLVETLAVHEVTVQSARAFIDRLPIHVGPVTFKMRWNPNATAPQLPAPAEALPTQADARQMSLFGAGWTLNSLKYLVLGGATTLTYYETVGYKGVMALETGSQYPDQFWDIAGGVYPMYHVFADWADCKGGLVGDLASSDSMRVDGCMLKTDERNRYLLANLTHEAQDCTLEVSGSLRLRRLDIHNVELAMREPEAYREQAWEIVQADGAGLHLRLEPFSLVTIDAPTL
ncbi:MAG: hypothetical protein NZ750_05300 [Anaerolineae bacterium]|nr:hypothetical protein [Anaerolineae bacterium]MDW8172704.1 hypothetical protein [Anaerolineae bacterium]